MALGNDWDRIWKAFHAALELPAAERASFLDATCGDDAGMRREIDDLLAHHGEMEDFLGDAGEIAGFLDDQEEARKLIGERIGPYEIVRLLGEGGMGAVYEAHQHEPVKRQVALKLIKLGMNTKEVTARFESERQALALMSHPGIAAVLDCGSTGDRRPFFVMELVDGPPITEHCDAGRAGTRSRLELFEQVCRAVQHAHRKGVIHRDLKPSNVLVAQEMTTADSSAAGAGDAPATESALPKVIDFGVAKAIHQRLTERTLYTEVGRVVGTPEYMSPEQAEVSGDVDTQSDVYSLGVILYELLVGTPPFDFRGKPYSELQRALAEEDPPVPSTRLSIDQDLDTSEIAARRSTDAEHLRRELRGELDWIVMKALAKDRGQRYGSAAELADDVLRFLNYEPVLAGPPSAMYRARKFARRHRVAVVGTAAALAALVVGLIGTSWMAVVASNQRRIAEQATQEAQSEAQFAKSINDLLLDMVASGDPWTGGSPGSAARDLLVVDVLDRTAASAGERLADRPRTEGALRAALGRTYLRLGLSDQADAELRQALVLLTRQLGDEHPQTLSVVNDLGVLANNMGDFEESGELLRRAVEQRRRVLGVDHRETLVSVSNLAALLVDLGELDAARDLYEGTVEKFRSVIGPTHPNTLTAEANLAHVLRELGDFAGAEALYRNVVERQREAIGAEHPSTLTALNNLATTLVASGNLADAEAAFREVVDARRRVLGPEHAQTLSALNNLSVVLYRQEKLLEAEMAFREIGSIYANTVGSDHPLAMAARNNLARVVMQQGRLEEADALYAELMPTATEVLPPNNVNLALYRSGYGLLLTQLERYPEAAEQLEASFAALSEAVGAEHPRTIDAIRRLVDLYERSGQPELAAKYSALLPNGVA